jgi:hypothetical protein
MPDAPQDERSIFVAKCFTCGKRVLDECQCAMPWWYFSPLALAALAAIVWIIKLA